jgi:non-homologous end joining protein Ku|tara:strand:+ start:723 stop:968 length:246 start_codon:yes stop_codon:yes gene_type:complete
MRVTRRQLKRIIKEEKAALLKENMGPFEGQDIIDGYYEAIKKMIHNEWAGAGVDPQESPEEVSYVAQALRNLLKDLETGQF